MSHVLHGQSKVEQGQDGHGADEIEENRHGDEQTQSSREQEQKDSNQKNFHTDTQRFLRFQLFHDRIRGKHFTRPPDRHRLKGFRIELAQNIVP